jgi:hypothetical protein
MGGSPKDDGKWTYQVTATQNPERSKSECSKRNFLKIKWIKYPNTFNFLRRDLQTLASP